MCYSIVYYYYKFYCLTLFCCRLWFSGLGIIVNVNFDSYFSIKLLALPRLHICVRALVWICVSHRRQKSANASKYAHTRICIFYSQIQNHIELFGFYIIIIIWTLESICSLFLVFYTQLYRVKLEFLVRQFYHVYGKWQKFYFILLFFFLLASNVFFCFVFQRREERGERIKSFVNYKQNKTTEWNKKQTIS